MKLTKLYLIYEGVEKIIKNKTKMISVGLISRMFGMIALSIIIPATSISAEAKSESYVPSKIVLSVDSHEVIKLSDNVSEIKPGESVVQRQAREKAEAEAKARAEAEAQARASEQATKSTSRKVKIYVDPSNFDQIYQKAQSVYGVDWRLLKAVHYVETGCSGSTSKRSYAGAVGPMQFLPSTWRSYGVDGNGDGTADITNVEDAVFSAARYLKACGYPNVKKALWGYNPSSAYYTKVMTVAHSLGF